MNAFKKLASETAIYGIPTIAGRFLNFLLVPLYTKSFTPAEYGVVSSMFAYASFLNVLLTYGMETTLFRFSVKYPGQRNVYSTAYNSLIITTFIFLFLALGFKNPIADWMEIGSHPEYWVWFALIAGFDTLSALPFVQLRQEGKAGKFAFIRSINIAVNIGLNLFFILLCPYLIKQGWGWVSAIYNPSFGIGYIFISNLIASAITLPLLYPENLGFNFGLDTKLLREMLPYAFPLLFVGFAGMINETLDRILLTKLLPKDIAERETGIYGACYKLSILMTLFIQAYRFAAEPFLFARSKNEDARHMYARLMDYFVIVCCVIFLFVSFNLQFFADLFLRKKEYQEGLDIVPILLLANICLGIYYNLSIWYKLADKTSIGSFISIIAAIITVVLNFILIPKVSYRGSAWTTFIVYLFMMVACYLWGRKYYNIPYRLNKIFAYLLLMLLFYIIQQYFERAAGRPVYVTGAVLLCIFGGILFANERYNLFGKIKSAFNEKGKDS